MAAVVNLPLTPDQFQKLLTLAQNDPKDIKSFTNQDGVGTIDTSDALLDFVYANGQLTVSVQRLYSFFARHASDKVVEGHISELLQKYTK